MATKRVKCHPVRLRAAVLAALLGASCSASNAPSQPPDIRALLVQITRDDLTTAIQIANAVTPADTPQVQCAGFLLSFIPSLAGPGAPGFITPAGVVSAFETVRIVAIDTLQGSVGLSSGQQTALDLACGALAVSTARLVAIGAIQLATLRPNSFVQMLLALAQAGAGGLGPFPLLPPMAAAVAPPPAPPQPAPGPTDWRNHVPRPQPEGRQPRRTVPYVGQARSVAEAYGGGPTIWASTLHP